MENNIFYNLKLEPHKSVLNGLKLYENINMNKLDLLINSNLLKSEFKYKKMTDLYNNEKKQLLKYKERYTDNGIEVLYNKSKVNIYGRSDPIYGLSGLNIRRDIRHTIFDNYMDIDIENCHPIILDNILDYHKIEHPLLKKYINNRDNYLDEVNKFHNVNRDQSKTLFLILMYGGSYDNWIKNNSDNKKKLNFIDDFQKEIIEFQKLISDKNPELLKIIKNKKKNNDYNINGKICSIYLQEKECLLLEQIYLYCKNNNYIKNNDCSLCADGLMLNKNHLIDVNMNELLKNLEINIKNKYKIIVKITNKEMNQLYNIDEIYNNMNIPSIIELNKDLLELKNTIFNNTSLENKRLKDIEKITKKRKNIIDKEMIIFNKNFNKEKKNYFKNVISLDEYENYKLKFEERFFKLENGIHYVDERELNFYESRKIKEYCRDLYPDILINNDTIISFSEYWLNDSKKRRYNNIVFEPNPDKYNDNNYNLFKGFDNYNKTENIISEDAYFFKLLKHICNEEEDIYEYILSWIAHIIKTPYKKTNVGIILYSLIGGIGKNAFIDCLVKLFDRYTGKLESIEDITNKFNVNLTNKLFIYGDEICAKATKLNDKLKNIITRPQQNLERKNIDPILINDYSNYIFTTNNQNAFKVESNDRRLFIVECSECILPSEFFKNYYNEINDEIKINELYNFFKNYNNKKWNIGVDRVPMTKLKKELEYENKPAYIQFLYKDIKNLCNRKWSATDFINQSKLYAKNNYLSSNYTSTEFGKAMKKMNINKIRGNSNNYYVIPIEIEFRKHLYNMDAKYYRLIHNYDDNEEIIFVNNQTLIDNEYDDDKYYHI
jgi:hypothetical protein